MLTGRLSGGSEVTSRPRRRIRPPVGSSKPPIIRRVVVLPQPDGPSSEKNSPLTTSSETPSTARTSRNRFSRSSSWISGDAGTGWAIIEARAYAWPSRRDAGRPVLRDVAGVPVRPEPQPGRSSTSALPGSRSRGDAGERALPIGVDRAARRRPGRPAAAHGRTGSAGPCGHPGRSRRRRCARRHGRRDQEVVDPHARGSCGTCRPGSPTTRTGRASSWTVPGSASTRPVASSARNAARSGSETWVPPWTAAASQTSLSVGATLRSPPSTSDPAGRAGLPDPASQPLEPGELARVERRADDPAVGRVQAHDPQPVDGRRQHPRLVERVEVVLARPPRPRRRPVPNRGPARHRSW